jgi:SAM-dependent methyltransferase
MSVVFKKKDLELFKKDLERIPKFWSRFEREPLFENQKILEIGCGHGSLSVYMASKGAQVIGLDIDEKPINFAKKNIDRNYPKLSDNIKFRCNDISDILENEFDMIVSQSAFEHIMNLKEVFYEMKKKLRSGGKMYIGFGPLYNSPYGDHRGTKNLMPWGHLIFSERKNIYEAELNKVSYFEYKKLFFTSGLNILYFKINLGDNIISKLFSLMRKIPFLEEYFTYNLYCILEKKSN